MDAFDKFVKERLEKRKDEASELACLKSNYFQDRLLELLEITLCTDRINHGVSNKKEFEQILKKNKIKIITVRTAFNKDSTLLKPIATFPKNKLPIAETIAHQHSPQEFLSIEKALDGIIQKYPGNISDELIDTTDRFHFSAVYKTDGCFHQHESIPGHESRFTYRIDKGFSMMNGESNQEFGSESVCVFSTIIKRSSCQEKFRISEIMALYFDKDVEISQNTLNEVHNKCEIIFEEIEQIKKIDNELFELEGHELMSDLQPLFLDENIAPSDKISFAVEQLKKLLNRHLNSHYPSSKGNTTEVYFVSLAYEIPDQERPMSLFPIFQVYPHVYRRIFPYGSFIIGHPDYVSFTKYLLRNYFQYHESSDLPSFVLGSTVEHESPVTISNKFMSELFYEVDTEVKDKGKYTNRDNPDQIFISKELPESQSADNTDLVWELLNVDIHTGNKQKEGNNSILAYVIEGHKINQHRINDSSKEFRQLPRAILAIESNQHEFLSDQERKSLRVVAVAFSNLVRHLFHDNTLLDYRLQLSKAYEYFADAVQDREEQELAGRFILASISVDASLLSDIQKQASHDDRISKETLNDMKNIFEKVHKDSKAKDEKIENVEVVRDKINERFKQVVSLIRDTNTSPSKEVVVLLEACPRNFAWAGYAPSLAQALGDRADHSPPEFELMSAGFSAAGLYMALVESEIRQVAKLSSVNKLKKERDNYKNFVRYKVFIAARSPSNAFAFDSTGEYGKKFGGKNSAKFLVDEKYEENCYGVLVSDLASAQNLEVKNSNGKDKVDTFIKLVTTIVSSPDKDSVFSVVTSIKNLFGKNLGYWYQIPKDKVLTKTTPIKILLKCYRLDYDKKLKGKKLKNEPDDWIEYYFHQLMIGDDDSEISHERGIFPFNENALEPKNIAFFLDRKFKNPTRIALPKHCKSLLSIIHGDLNSRNLVWAGPINNLILIDFEHVDIGFWGMDQARLAINTIVDFLSEIKSFSGKRLSEELAESISNAVNFILDLWNKYSDASTAEDITMVNNIFDNLKKDKRWKTQPDKILKNIVQWIIKTTWFNKELLDDDLFGIFQACISFSIVKEYEYSIVNIRRLKLKQNQILCVNNILHDKNTLKEQLLYLYACEQQFDLSSTQGRHELASISKFLISKWMLENIFESIEFKTNQSYA